MASLSAPGARSPSSLSQQQQSYHHHHHLHNVNGVYAVSPCASASSIFVARSNLLQHQHHRQCSTSSSCTTFTVAGAESNFGDCDNVSLLSFSSGRLQNNDCNNKVLYESDFSSPTSWEFRTDNCACQHHLHHHSLSSPPCQSHFKEIRMPATSASASSPMVLPLSLPPQASSSSGGSSVSTTPSPLEEHGPSGSSAYYPFPMQLSLLRSNHNVSSSSPAASVVRNVSNSGNCSCVPLSSSNRSKNVINDGEGVVGDEELLLSSHDLANGNGSDGSRNSTGSHRSQDSGFSDSGETRRRKSSNTSNNGSVIIHSPVAADMTFSGGTNRTGSLNGTHVVNGSINHDHYLHPSQQNSINGHYQHHQQQQHQQRIMYNGNGGAVVDYECANGSNPNYCGASSRPCTPSVQNVYGQNCSPSPAVVNHLHSNHVYDHLSSGSSMMPSPIPPAGFGCGRLISSPNLAHLQKKNAETFSGGALIKRPTPPRRPASVDTSITLDGNSESTNGVNGAGPLRRRSPSPSSPVATTTCTNCLSSSINFHNQQQRHQRRSFSPSKSHDISALASSSTATAMAALQVPLSSSTPKRATPPSSSSSSLRLSGNGNMNVVKIDNFETLNKNVNKDNNNNSSGNNNSSSSASNTPAGSGKKGNKTFVIHSSHNKDSAMSAPSNVSSSSHLNSNGTVLVEEDSQHRRNHSSNHREMSHQNKQSNSSSNSGKSRTAAESIYDKICSRLSSFSSSTSSSSSSSSTAVASPGMDNQTVVLHQKNSSNKSNIKSLSLLPTEPAIAGSMDQFHCDASSQSSNSNSKSIHASSEQREHFERNSASPSPSSSSSSTSKLKLFPRTSTNGSQKSLSLPRGLSSNRLSIFEEVGVEVDETPKGEQAKSPSGMLPTSSTSTSTQTCSPPKEIWKAIEQQVDSQVVRLWLHDLRTQTEPECLHSLQTKWIVPAENRQDDEEDDDLESDDIPRSTTTATESRSISPATSSSAVGITASTASTTTTGGGHGHHHLSPLSSFSSKYSHPRLPKSISPVATSEDYVIGPMVSSSVHRFISNSNHHVKPSSSTSYVAKHRQRRSQQKFLSSMTAAIHAVSTPLMSIRNVETTANIISGEFSKICKHLEFGIFTQVPTLVLSLVGHIEDFLRSFHAHTRIPGVSYANLKKLEARLENACAALDAAAKSMNETALMISTSSDSGGGGGGGGNPPPLPPRLSSSNSTPISSPDSMQEASSSSKSYRNHSNDPYLVMSSPSPMSSDPEPESLDMQQYHVVVGEVVEGIVTVGNLFSQVVDLRLTRDLASILDTIEGGGIPGRIALKSLVTVLADGGNHMCRLSADIRTVRGLLGVLLDTREDQDKILALRCLATVLCVGEAVKDFDKAGGFEIIADLLYDSAYSTWMKIEAVAVLTQATDPWIDLESTLMTLGVHLEKFIVSLTKLIGEFKTEEEPFLLIVAAISNLTFLEVASTEYLKRCRTVSFLIDAVHGGNANFSVFVLDHIATILANMAGVESCRQEIIHCGGIDALLQFLQQRPSLPGKTDTVSAITACERLQQKSTIAISRLANEDGVARYVFDMGGVHRLVTLCRKEKERNYSDGVLIAALATLRKLVSICGEDAVKGLGGAEDLIEPRLLDSFLLYSSRQESYV